MFFEETFNYICLAWPLSCFEGVGPWTVVFRTINFESMGCRRGENFDKRNVFDKKNVVESMGCRGGENCDKRNVFDKRNVVVESMGCRGGKNFDKWKSGKVADDPW